MSKSVVVFVVLLIGGIALAGFYVGTRDRQAIRPSPHAQPLPLPDMSIVANDSETEAQIRYFCGACHAVPTPDLLPRLSWPGEISNAYRRFRESGREDLVAPDRGVITDYFTRMAPDDLVFPGDNLNTPTSLMFQSQTVDLPEDRQDGVVAFFNPLDSRTDGHGHQADLLLCDFRSGWVEHLSWSSGVMSKSPIVKLKNPSHIIECDFDNDGHQDFLVADLGVPLPSDDMKGSVVLARSSGPENSFETIVVKDGLGRVADAELADLDGDGDYDFVAAEFGFEKAGRLIWLETLSITNGRPETQMHVIDPRHGSIHSPLTDLDHDGDLDLVVLISQEHEAIVAFLNDGHGHFEKQTLFQAGNPSYGSSGMELVDLDRDGDLDVLFTNGDTLDTFQIRPFHAVNWLENCGDLHFEYHQLTTLPGATRAVAADFDNDGDLDIAAVAYYPSELRFQKRPENIDTIIWLEQTSPRNFERHVIESSSLGHMALAVGDFDGDQDCDIAVGEFPASYSKGQKYFTIYWNQLNPAQNDRKTTLRIEN